MSATALSVIGPIAGTLTGATPSPVAIALANMTQMTAGPIEYSFPNTGNNVVVVLCTTAAGGFIMEPVIYPTTAGAVGGTQGPLGLTVALTAMQVTIPSVIGAYVVGPFGPSKFNDSNGLAYVSCAASATTVYIGVYSLPGAMV